MEVVEMGAGVGVSVGVGASERGGAERAWWERGYLYACCKRRTTYMRRDRKARTGTYRSS
jgi:hypothetical protein